MHWSISKTREYLLYLFVFILPWQTRWIIRDTRINWFALGVVEEGVWEYGRISLYGWDVLLLILMVLCWPLVVEEIKNQILKCKIATQNFIIRNSKSKINPNIQYQNSKSGLFLIGFIIWLLITVLWTPDALLALVWLIRLLEGGLLFLLIRVIKPWRKYIFFSLSLAGTLQALWGIWQFLTQTTFSNKWLGVAVHDFLAPGSSVVLTSAGRWLRSYGGQVHPNVLGGLLVITALMTAYLIINNLKLKILNFKWLWLLYITQIAGLFFTFSRGAWLALVVSLLIIKIQNQKSKIQNKSQFLNSNIILDNNLGSTLKWVLIITVTTFIALSTIFYKPTLGRLFGGSRLEQQSVEERVGSVSDSMLLLKNNWWHGVGLGNYTVALQKLHPNLPSFAYQPVHNIFLLIFTELGIVGLLLFLYLLYKQLKKIIIHDSLFLIPVVVTSIFDHYWLTIPSMMILFWLVMLLIDKRLTDSSSFTKI